MTSILVMGIKVRCVLAAQGYPSCGNLVSTPNGDLMPPCSAGLLEVNGKIHRLIYDVVLSRPEDYLSVYQSCCNHQCAMCHSWYFTQRATGSWYSPEDLVKLVIRYSEIITVREPRSRATMWHASDLCAHCGMCKLTGRSGPFCPRKLRPEQVVFSPQGWGPARNIVSFTGGDLYCQPRFYIETFKLIKREVPDMWIHIETNGYGLTPKNLELLYEAGLDSIWLDMKACNESTYQTLCGTTNKWILRLPSMIRDLGIVLEVVLLYIPALVEVDEIECFAKLLSSVDKEIPVMLLAFFPEFKLRTFREPTYNEITNAYKILRKYGLRNVKIGNVGVFCKDYECIRRLISEVGREGVSL